jgi:hypothetical protein
MWSVEQRQWLKALGHTVYVQGAALAPEVVEAPSARKSPPAIVPAPVPAPVRSRRPDPVATTEPVVAVAPARRATSRLPDKLHFALIRASGCNPNAPDAASIIAQWPASSALRGNAAAKRALWPQLRALRKRQVP